MLDGMLSLDAVRGTFLSMFTHFKQRADSFLDNSSIYNLQHSILLHYWVES